MYDIPQRVDPGIITALRLNPRLSDICSINYWTADLLGTMLAAGETGDRSIADQCVYT